MRLQCVPAKANIVKVVYLELHRRLPGLTRAQDRTARLSGRMDLGCTGRLCVCIVWGNYLMISYNIPYTNGAGGIGSKGIEPTPVPPTALIRMDPSGLAVTPLAQTRGRTTVQGLFPA